MARLAALTLALAGIGATAAASAGAGPVIQDIISPDSIVLVKDGTRAITPLTGKPVYFCGMRSFKDWARPLLGQAVYADRSGKLTVVIDSRPVGLEKLLVGAGWLLPGTLDDDAQAAITEHRGGWNCAGNQAAFDLLHGTVDPKVLAGIAMNESNYAGRPWPWTLNVAGRGYFFRSREGAYRAITYLLSQDRCDFDVGLMQVNWCYHHQRFASPWDALKPSSNIQVAESILNEYYRKTHSVAQAVAYYHSANPEPGREYLARFVQHLDQLEAGS
ncbi:transglycosylase SLT domain-containing protein [Paraburkholderia domus]|uniref:transglycosylase SLT domain-containing protein n=1 Tax=Paraburkholderia domus TaxID=2793075 RepID=UPI001914CFAC|nr:transglycosylase SLT domain-containing protein [Paraburkholderia domus]MBK5064796.1 transglycosylase SLT domain-containing protein [Burkholderia sp. R-70199]CAE6956485.1 hypothetical protein R70199_06993 [Paraburkholderia domus]